MKISLLAILGIFIFSLLPFPTNQTFAQVPISKSIDDDDALMYISDAILLDESELDDSPDAIGMLSPTKKRKEDVDTNPLLARFIHAKKWSTMTWMPIAGCSPVS